MKVLVIGSGGREHALCLGIKKSSSCNNLYCIPGSDAISSIAECYPIDINNKKDILNFCNNYNISFVVIGPEIPLIEGLTDFVHSRVLCYPECRTVPVHFIGTIAYFSEDIIRAVLQPYGIEVGNIVRRPIDALVEHYRKNVLTA